MIMPNLAIGTIMQDPMSGEAVCDMLGYRSTGIENEFMTVESTPEFTRPAAVLWAAIPSEAKKMLISNVWCGKCRHEVTITNFTGAVSKGDLLLVGKCSECQGDVARVIESV